MTPVAISHHYCWSLPPLAAGTERRAGSRATSAAAGPELNLASSGPAAIHPPTTASPRSPADRLAQEQLR